LDLFSTAIAFGIVLASLTVHEAAHAWTANRLGDPTARMLGRMSLNPIVHMDLIGTVILPVVAALSGLPVIGWAKPVPVNISRLRRQRQDFVLVAAAGPLSNIALAVAAALALRTLDGMGPDDPGAYVQASVGMTVLIRAIEINLLLAFFNLIPIPPLDGGNVLGGLLPDGPARLFDGIRPYGFILLYALMLSGVLTQLIVPPMLFFGRMLIP
jgi:Zn-dependent protease